MIPIGGRKNRVFCFYCKREVTFQFYIHCAECKDINVNLCNDCFAIGIQLDSHVPCKTHRCYAQAPP